MNKNEAVKLRVEMIDENFDLGEEELKFIKLSRELISELADKLSKACPTNANVGRFIAAIDHLQQTKYLVSDAVTLGAEEDNRKRRKTATSSGNEK